MAEAEDKGSAVGKQRKQRFWRGCAVSLFILSLVLFVLFWLVSLLLSPVASRIVREQAAASLNGELAFDSLEVTLAGHAEMRGLELRIAGENEPVLSCPDVRIRYDLLGLLFSGGEQAVSVRLVNPELTLIREADCGFNVVQLVKPQGPSGDSEQALVLSVLLDGLDVDFSDYCLLTDSYPRIPAGSAFTAELLDELGYSTEGLGGPVEPHRELIRVDGKLILNTAERKLVAEADLERVDAGGSLSLNGSARLDGTAYAASLEAQELELSGFSAYIGQLFPALRLPEDVSPVTGRTPPYAKATLSSISAQVRKEEGSPVAVNAGLEVDNVAFAVNGLPTGAISSLSAAYNSNGNVLDVTLGPGDIRYEQFAVALEQAELGYELDTSALDASYVLSLTGLSLDGSLRLTGPEQVLGGSVSWRVADLGRTLEALTGSSYALAGNAVGGATLRGTLAKPQVQAVLSGGDLRYGTLELGSPGGTVDFGPERVQLKDTSISGGEISLRADGWLDYGLNDAELNLETGLVSIRQTEEVINQIAGRKGTRLPLTGNYTAQAQLRLAGGELDSSVELASGRILVAGQLFRDVAVSGRLEESAFRTEQATGVWVAPFEVDTATYNSRGHLETALRIGGSVSWLPGSPVVLGLTGQAATTNLEPEVEADFKAIGPVPGLELRAQAKSPLGGETLAVAGTAQLESGDSPVEATLSWKNSAAQLAGKMNTTTGSISGNIAVQELDLRQLSSDIRLTGKLTADIDIGGTLAAPAASGWVELPEASVSRDRYSLFLKDVELQGDYFHPAARADLQVEQARLVTDRQTYSARSVDFNFERTADGSIAIDRSRFVLEDNRFTAHGMLSEAGNSLVVESPEFNLLNIVAISLPVRGPDHEEGPQEFKPQTFEVEDVDAIELVDYDSELMMDLWSRPTQSADLPEPPTEVTAANADTSGGSDDEAPDAPVRPLTDVLAAGPLKIEFLGTLKEPAARVEFVSGSDSWSGYGLSAVELEALVEMDGARVEKLVVREPGGQVEFSGDLDFSPLSYQAQARAESFDIGTVVPVLRTPQLAGLTGELDAELEITGGRDEYDVAGEMELSNIDYRGLELDQATATVRTSGRQLEIRNCRITGERTLVTIEGTLGPEPTDTNFTFKAEPLNLRLLNPLLSADTPPLRGAVDCTLVIKPVDAGEQQQHKAPIKFPDVEMVVTNRSQVRAGQVVLDDLDTEFTVKNDLLNIKRFMISAGGNPLSLQGKLYLGTYGQSSTVELPLGLRLESQDFAVEKLRVLVPGNLREYFPSGVLTAKNLIIGGTNVQPEITLGELSFDLREMPPQAGFIDSIEGTVKFVQNEFETSEIRITPVGADATAGESALLRGSGKLSLIPPGLEDGFVDIVLAPEGDYLPVDTRLKAVEDSRLPFDFYGQLGGVIHVRGGTGDVVPEVSGHLVVTEQDSESAIVMKQFQSSGSGGGTFRYRFGEKHYSGTEDDGGNGEAVELAMATDDTQPNAEAAAGSVLDPELADVGVSQADTSRGLVVVVNPGTRFYYDPGQLIVDMEAELMGSVIITGEPSIMAPGHPDALDIDGSIKLLDGSFYAELGGDIPVFQRRVRLEGDMNRLTFAESPGDIMPYLSVRGYIVLPRVLSPTTTTTTALNPGITGLPNTGAIRSARDLRVIFTLSQLKLATNPAELDIEDKFRLTSDPPLPEDQIMAYLLGGAGDVLAGQTDVGTFAESQLSSIGSGLISRTIERYFNLDLFRFGGTGAEHDPFYLLLEKEVTDDLTMSYFREFLQEENEASEIGLRYKVYEERYTDRYRNLTLEVNYQMNTFYGSETELMLTWNERF